MLVNRLMSSEALLPEPADPRVETTDALVVGAGMYGCYIACLLRQEGRRVVLLDRAPKLLTRASYANQARVHNGYHYPRSVLTALRSHVNFGRFIDEFRPCIDDSFQMYYAIARQHSKVTARQFERFCRAVGAPLAPAPAGVTARFDDALTEAVFAAEEFAFDAIKLAAEMHARLAHHAVDTRLGHALTALQRTEQGLLATIETEDGTTQVAARHVFNCTYSNINGVLALGGRPRIPLKHELTEMALVDVPASLKHEGVTVMCGPFFSIMPFPSTPWHTLSHVRYTPHGEWHDRPAEALRFANDPEIFEKTSHFPSMIRDAARYLPELAACTQRGSLWEIKTVLPQNESDDGRPILWKRDAEWPQLISVMGGKIDNIYDMAAEISSLLAEAA